ncbi:MAG: NUDIX hydrolase [Erysipelotrichales bacterium]|nr:NUDIX hydrolase [Erysipelotrichales bacterium]MBQ1385759.1 NUDIX hydrolase [Erysipelotrichales bacterium]MBQ2309593.1 NUDIX hydrolase [Erysipelotrichales bacterium]MBQ4011756.1 NUDIX hydrolase [Erysipelotrichales bacterium]
MAKRDLTRVDKNGLTEEEYLRGYNSDKFPKPSLTADIVIFRGEEVLLIRRGGHPYLGCWATPGGFAEKNEELINTARRELEEETGLKMKDLTLVGVYSKPGRDPRGWTVSAAYMADVTGRDVRPVAADDAEKVGWFRINETPELVLTCGEIVLREEDLAFDHADILKDALAKRKEK